MKPWNNKILKEKHKRTQVHEHMQWKGDEWDEKLSLKMASDCRNFSFERNFNKGRYARELEVYKGNIKETLIKDTFS